jgi:hypothetical protein
MSCELEAAHFILVWLNCTCCGHQVVSAVMVVATQVEE